MPMASGQDMRGASWSATTEFTPRPAASAIGTLPMTPMSSVVKAAVRTVAVTSWPLFRWCPYMSFALPRMIGFSTMMYAIAKKVAKPPRISRPRVLPRSEILK